MPPPVRQYSPTPGIFVDVAEKTITISGRAELWGGSANEANAATAQATLQRMWSIAFPDGYSTLCTVTVGYRPTSRAALPVLQIEYKTMVAPSNAIRGGSGKTSRIELSDTDANALSWVVGHEFGHVLGMKDRYQESSWSKIKSKFGGERTTTVDDGYDGHLMAVDEGAMSSKTIQDLGTETLPDWMDEDDQVVAWVRSHTLGDIRALPTSHKIGAIKALMDGWISDDDMAAIEKIIAGVASPTEARALQSSLNPYDFTSIGQRTRLRVAFSKVLQ
jgi:hypothetical protein